MTGSVREVDHRLLAIVSQLLGKVPSCSELVVLCSTQFDGRLVSQGWRLVPEQRDRPACLHVRQVIVAVNLNNLLRLYKVCNRASTVDPATVEPSASTSSRTAGDESDLCVMDCIVRVVDDVRVS